MGGTFCAVGGRHGDLLGSLEGVLGVIGLVVFAHRQPVLVEPYGVVDVVLGAKELWLSRLYHDDGVGERLYFIQGIVSLNVSA